MKCVNKSLPEVQDDYYVWLKDNFKSFFDHGNPDWEWIKEKIKNQ